MKSNFIHVCFIIDESGSMMGSESSVCSGFKKIVDEQKAVEQGSCAISLYKFSSNVRKCYVGEDVHKVQLLTPYNERIPSLSDIIDKVNPFNTGVKIPPCNLYYPSGGTSLYDGVCTAVDEIGEWLNDMPEDERPEKNLIVIMTDGEENMSTKFTLKDVQDKIKHQTEKYNWSFMYIGNDLSSTEQADSMGIVTQAYTTKKSMDNVYSAINTINTAFRIDTGDSIQKAKMFVDNLSNATCELNAIYAEETGLDLASKE